MGRQQPRWRLYVWRCRSEQQYVVRGMAGGEKHYMRETMLCFVGGSSGEAASENGVRWGRVRGLGGRSSSVYVGLARGNTVG